MSPQKPQIKYDKLFIGNEFVDSVNGKKFEVVDPSTESVVAKVAEAEQADVDKAVIAARKAMQIGSPWRTMDASKRGQLMRKAGVSSTPVL